MDEAGNLDLASGGHQFLGLRTFRYPSDPLEWWSGGSPHKFLKFFWFTNWFLVNTATIV